MVQISTILDICVVPGKAVNSVYEIQTVSWNNFQHLAHRSSINNIHITYYL